MELSANDRAVIENLTNEIKGLKESLNEFQNSSLTPTKIDAFITAINNLSARLNEQHLYNLEKDN